MQNTFYALLGMASIALAGYMLADFFIERNQRVTEITCPDAHVAVRGISSSGYVCVTGAPAVTREVRREAAQ